MELFAEMPNYANYIFSLDLEELNTIPVPDPRAVIVYPGENDILCGRGGETNNHRYVRRTAGTRGKSIPAMTVVEVFFVHFSHMRALFLSKSQWQYQVPPLRQELPGGVH